MQGDRIAASAVAQWAWLADCPGEIWSPYVGRPSERGTPTGLLQALILISTKADGGVLVLKVFYNNPPSTFYPILSGLLAPCLS